MKKKMSLLEHMKWFLTGGGWNPEFTTEREMWDRIEKINGGLSPGDKMRQQMSTLREGPTIDGMVEELKRRLPK